MASPGTGGYFNRLPLCSHLLQQSLRSFCVDSQWLYAVFWRILPRNFPPPKWEVGGYLDRTKANKRNWILVWEDGYCDFARATASAAIMQPDLFFKMSHEIYNYGEGLMGKVSAENGHKWIHKEPSQTDSTPSWQNTIDIQPRTWDPQFKAGIQTILVIAVREGLVQLGSTQKVQEDVNFVAVLQTRFNSMFATLSTSLPLSPLAVGRQGTEADQHDQPIGVQRNLERRVSLNGSMAINGVCQLSAKPAASNNQMSSHGTIMPSMTSLQALLSKLPSVTSTQINHINTSKTSGHNASVSYPYHASPPLRSVRASQEGDLWMQDLSQTSHSAAVSSGSHLHHRLGPSFMALDPNVAAAEEEHSFMGDLMG